MDIQSQGTEKPLGERPGLGPWRAGVRWSTVFAVALLVVALLISLWSVSEVEESTESRIARTGVVRIGYAQEPPYAFRNEQGRVTGESPEVARAVWERLGIHRIEWIQTDFGSLIAQLRAGRFDQIASGLFIRPERELLVAFTSPSICIGPALLVRRGNPLKLQSFSDVVHTEAKLAVISGAVEGQDASRAGVAADRIISYPNVIIALQALRNGEADALTLSAPTIQQLAESNPDMQQALPFAAPAGSLSCGAFAFRLTDQKLRDRFDQVLQHFIGSKEHVQLLHGVGISEESIPHSGQIHNRESLQ